MCTLQVLASIGVDPAIRAQFASMGPKGEAFLLALLMQAPGVGAAASVPMEATAPPPAKLEPPPPPEGLGYVLSFNFQYSVPVRVTAEYAVGYVGPRKCWTGILPVGNRFDELKGQGS